MEHQQSSCTTQPRRFCRLAGLNPSEYALHTEEGNEHFLAALEAPDKDLSKSYSEAMRLEDRDKWKEAMDKEMSCFKKNDTYTLVPRPKGANILGNK